MPLPGVLTVTERCPDCAVEIGQQHRRGCDVARCLATGEQRLQCYDSAHCGRDKWTGTWPGEAECIEFGWWTYFDRGWQRCDASHPEAMPDLNRLVYDARWDREQGRWIRREEAGV